MTPTRSAPKDLFGWFLSVDIDDVYEMTSEPVAARWSTPEGDVFLFNEVGVDELIPLPHYMSDNEVFVGAYAQGDFPPPADVEDAKRRLAIKMRRNWRDIENRLSLRAVS
jgi:hypothetical protein